MNQEGSGRHAEKHIVGLPHVGPLNSFGLRSAQRLGEKRTLGGRGEINHTEAIMSLVTDKSQLQSCDNFMRNRAVSLLPRQHWVCCLPDRARGLEYPRSSARSVGSLFCSFASCGPLSRDLSKRMSLSQMARWLYVVVAPVLFTPAPTQYASF